MKTLVFSTQKFEMPFLEKSNKKEHLLFFEKESLSIKTVEKAKGFDAISILTIDVADKQVLESLKEYGVKYITLRSVGFDNVDLKTAIKLNIKIANVPAYSPYAIAEHAIALLLALNRNLIASNKKVENYNFDLNELTGFDLNQKTVGIVGTGRTGSIMAKILNGFGCNLLAYDTISNQNLIDDYNIQYTSLEQLCEKSDIITLHVPLNINTHHLIDKKLFNVMKPNMVIINTARGAVINTDDLIMALENKQIKAAGLDVYEFEKGVFFKNHSNDINKDNTLQKLIKMPNVLLSGHHAFLTEEALTNIAETTINNLSDFQSNGSCKNELY